MNLTTAQTPGPPPGPQAGLSLTWHVTAMWSARCDHGYVRHHDCRDWSRLRLDVGGPISGSCAILFPSNQVILIGSFIKDLWQLSKMRFWRCDPRIRMYIHSGYTFHSSHSERRLCYLHRVWRQFLEFPKNVFAIAFFSTSLPPPGCNWKSR